MTPIDPVDYKASLPKKRMGSGVIFFNDKEELLILKTTYKDGWTIPGGTVDRDESPRQAAVREVKEETGLDISSPQFIGIDYKSNKGNGDNLQFIFYGGILTNSDIKNIMLQQSEISEYRFMKIEEVLLYVSPGLKARLPRLMPAIREGKSVYLENGL